jgi:hypothetical protein
MPCGAGLPLMLLPDEATANQVRMRFHWSGGAIPIPESFATQLQIKRRFIEHCGYSLHGALSGDQKVAARLHRLHAVALHLNLPMLCEVIVAALAGLEHIMEHLTIDEIEVGL